MPWPLLEPCESPVIAPVPVMFEIVFPDVVVAAPKLVWRAVMPLVPPAMLLNVLLLIVLVLPLVLLAPSVFDHPAMAVAPVTVTFEKLFPVLTCEDPFTDEALEEKKVI